MSADAATIEAHVDGREGVASSQPPVVERILELARWAPSGDNEQCWRFEIAGPEHVVVHGYDTRHHCVYDLDGTASQIGLGALVETMSVAASRFGRGAVVERRAGTADERPLIDVRFVVDPRVRPDALAVAIETRTVNRRPLATRPLTPVEKAAFDAAAGPDFAFRWFEGAADKRRMARLLFASAKIRLIMPEAYAVHREAIEWRARFSDDRVPEAAVGLDPMTARMMRWVMRSWPRVRFFNRYLAGTWMPRLQLDVIPALACAGHFVLVARKPPSGIDDYIATGRALQRIWLTATTQGLQLQPEATPIIFARYSRRGIPFTTIAEAAAIADRVARRLAERLGAAEAERAVFMGRIGAGTPASTRSRRLPLSQLMWNPAADPATLVRALRTSDGRAGSVHPEGVDDRQA